MEVRLGLLADEAHVADSGKLSINGVFEKISAKTFPVTHLQLMLVLVFRVGSWDEGDHELIIDLVDADGVSQQSLKTAFHIGHKEREETLNILLSMAMTKFRAPGDYSFDVYYDGRHVWGIPLRAELLASPSTS